MLQDTRLHVVAGFILMGLWGYHANRGHDSATALQAGLVQGCLSGLLTLLLKKTVDHLRHGFAGNFGYLMPPFLAVLGSTSLLVLVHKLAGTPEILSTIIVPMTFAGCYITLYNALAKRTEDRANA